MNLNKKFNRVLAMILIISSMSSLLVSAAYSVDMYSADGRCITVWSTDVEAYKAVGWYDNIDDVRTTLYSGDKSITVYNSEVSTYLSLGWHRGANDTKTTLYSQYGSVEVNKTEVESYLAVGWSLTPVKLDNITVLPVNFTKSSSYSYYEMTFDSFEITDSYYSSYNDEITLFYYVYAYGDTYMFDLVMDCYDSYGNFVGSENFSLDNSYIDIPSNTAWFTIKPSSSYSYTVNGEYFHCKQVDLYSDDGRNMVVFDVQVPKHTQVGWHEEVTLYSLDGRTCTVPHYMVESYKAVGWYTEAGYNYYRITNEYDFQMASYNWEGAMDVVDSYMGSFYGTEYEWPAQQKKEKAMDKWRNSVKKPLVMTSHYISGSGYSQEANITFRNLSYKTIVAFRLKFTCYNIFGEKINSYYRYYYCDNAYITSGDSSTISWSLNIYDKIYSIKNVEIYDVVFADGTMV